MIIVPFPIGLGRKLEEDVCRWIGENKDIADLNETGDAVEIKDEQTAIYFRLRFGL